MKDLFKITLFTILFIMVVTWFVQGNSFFLYKVFAPQMEQTRREVFEQTKSYNQGMVQELRNMQFEYIKASPEHKAALASVILHRVSEYDENKLPSDLKSFIYQLKKERMNLK